MQLCLDDVRKVFLDLLDARISRDNADRWAYSVMQAREIDGVVFVPPGDAERIWDGVMHLIGIDLQDSPGQYLYSDESIRDFMLKTVGTA